MTTAQTSEIKLKYPTPEKYPLVTIGITTYNRPKLLKKTLESAINQSYDNLEILVTDDNSDGIATDDLLKQASLKDKRIKYYKQKNKIGALGVNFLINKASGKYFMWLCDDDFIDKDYVKKCVNYIIANEDYALVTGKTIFHSESGFTYQAESVNVEDCSPFDRILTFYKSQLGTANSPNFGIVNLNRVRNIKLKNIQGHDNIWVSNLAFLGKIKTLEDVHIYRLLGGSSLSLQKLAQTFNYSSFEFKYPLLALGFNIIKDITLESKALISVNPLKRIYLSIKFLLHSLVNLKLYLNRYKKRMIYFSTPKLDRELVVQ